MRKFILAILCTGPLLAACAGDPATRATVALGVACDNYAFALDQLAPMAAAGRLSAETIARVNAVNAQVAPLCRSDSLVDPAAAVGTVERAIALINQARSN